MFTKKFNITRKLDEGAQGEVYVASDLVSGHEKYVAKIFKDPNENKEAKVISKIRRLSRSKSPYRFPKIYDQGNVDGKYFLVTRRYTTSLDNYLNKGNQLEPSQALEIIIQLLDIFKDIHESGFTYNDLKPENIMLNNSSDGSVHATLIDFGYAKEYVPKQHLEEADFFEGNMYFASVN